MASRQDLVIANCETCMRATSKEQRQHLGCGYEPPIDRVRLTIWKPPAGKHGYRGPEPTMCAGYLTSLPEVQETSVLRVHWENGSLRDACDGEQPTEETLALLVRLKGAYSALQRWIMTPSKDGGGGA